MYKTNESTIHLGSASLGILMMMMMIMTMVVLVAVMVRLVITNPRSRSRGKLSQCHSLHSIQLPARDGLCMTL